MLWGDWLEHASLGLGLTVTQTGILISFVVTLAVLIVVAMVSGRALKITAPLALLLSISLFVFLGWFPSLLGSIMAFIFAVFIGISLFRGG